MWETWVRSLGSGRSPGEGNGNPLQYSCLENPMDGGTWRRWGRKEWDATERLHSLTHSLIRNFKYNNIGKLEVKEYISCKLTKGK